GPFDSLFQPIDKKLKVFAKKPGSTASFPSNRLVPQPQKILRDRIQPQQLPESESAALSAQREADRLALARYGPPGVLVNSAQEIMQFRGDTSQYLTPPHGRATFNILKMAREGLLLPLRNALNKAKKDNKTVRKEDI